MCIHVNYLEYVVHTIIADHFLLCIVCALCISVVGYGLFVQYMATCMCYFFRGLVYCGVFLVL